MRNLAILTLGCKVNQYESEAISQIFQANGYNIVTDLDIADICVINTCSVTNMSDRKSRQLIRKCVKANKNPLVAVIGCYSQAKPLEAANIPGVSVVIGTNNKKEIFSLVNRAIEDKNSIVKLFPETRENSFNFEPVTSYQEKTRAIIKIQDGCNSFCSYCIIPYVRGRCRSRNADDIIKEASDLADNGYKELVLSGIHVCHYGVDLTDMSFVELLSMLSEISKIERIRLSSIEPSAFNDQFFEFYKHSKKLCPHFHISLQSGSNSVLKRMNRHYSSEDFHKIIKKLREINPFTEITTDVIVGFPGETEEEFSDTVNLVLNAGFLKVHTFKYSKREGTKAALFENQISGSISEERSKKIIKISEQIEINRLQAYVGKRLNVLIENEKDGLMYGVSENYIPVFINEKNLICGKIYNVLIERAEGLSAYGRL